MRPVTFLFVCITLLLFGCKGGRITTGSEQNAAFLAQIKPDLTPARYEALVKCLTYVNTPLNDVPREFAMDWYKMQEQHVPASWLENGGWAQMYDFVARVGALDLPEYPRPRKNPNEGGSWAKGYIVVPHLYPAPDQFPMTTGLPLNTRVVLELVPLTEAKKPYQVAWHPSPS